jgi:hypothetical protein
MARELNTWFQTPQGDEYSPAMSITELRTLIQDHVGNYGVSLNCKKEEFSKHLCEALCIWYSKSNNNRKSHRVLEVVGPRRVFPRPKGWTDELERLWTEYVQWKIFGYEEWDTLWSALKQRDWEQEAPGWRGFFQSFLPIYLKPDPQRLVDEGFLFQEGTEWVLAEDHVADEEDK